MKNVMPFSRALLHPRYWFTWLGLGLLWLLVQMPHPLLMRLGAFLGGNSRRFLKRREKILRRNLELCFPNFSEAQKEQLIQENFLSLGMALLETGMAWFWSDAQIKKWFNVEGLHHLHQANA